MSKRAARAATLVLVAAGVLTTMPAFAQHEAELEPAGNNIANTASLQRGAKYFVNYCLGCHSAKYVRYNKLAEGLRLTEDQLIQNLMFTGEQPFDTLSNAMRAEDALRWFGIAPPDLSLIARSRGADYIFGFLRGFYADDSTASGANNVVLPNTAMPHVLWQLQGVRRPVYAGEQHAAGGEDSGAGEAQAAEAADEDGEAAESAGEPGEIVDFEVVQAGLLTEEEYDQVARDLVNFLVYIGEPMQQERRALGIKVIAFLLVFLLIAYLLKKEIWKDVA